MYEKYLLQLEEAGKIRNLKERSIDCYKNYVSYFLNYMEKVPEELTCQDVRDFLLAKKDDGLKATTLNLYNSAIRFFYRNVLHILWDDITVPRMMIDHKLPVVLSVDEIDKLLDATDDLKYKAMFATMYSSGMRVSEVVHLHYGDISRTHMQIHVRDTKTVWTVIPFFPSGIWHFLQNTGLHVENPVIFFSRINLQGNTLPFLPWNRLSAVQQRLPGYLVLRLTASVTALPPT